MPVLNSFTGKLLKGQSLSTTEAREAFALMMTEAPTPVQISAFLTALSAKGETVNEIKGAVETLLSKAHKIKAPQGSIDTCGTGADGSSTYNISTTVAFVLAAAGVPVAKHGNRAVSSKSGSSDVLTALGIKVDAPLEVMKSTLESINIAFLMAPLYHPSMRRVAPIRAELGFRTIFNLLGPLLNPARADFQLVGVYSRKWMAPFAEVLMANGTKKAWIVHGSDGMDEITVTGKSWITQLEHQNITHFEVHPQDFGLRVWPMKDLEGHSPSENAAALKEVLQGREGAYRDAIILNSAAGLCVAGKSKGMKQAVSLATQIIDSGDAWTKVEDLIKHSNAGTS